jgi:hypothetical protein
VATELASDIVVNVGDVKFYLHKVMFYSIEHSFCNNNTVFVIIVYNCLCSLDEFDYPFGC